MLESLPIAPPSSVEEIDAAQAAPRSARGQDENKTLPSRARRSVATRAT